MSKLKRPIRLPAFLRVVLVEWEDATHQADEHDAPLGTMIAYTIGFLVRNTKKDVVLCGEVFEDGGRRDITAIAKPMVRRIIPVAKIPVQFPKGATAPPSVS